MSEAEYKPGLGVGWEGGGGDRALVHACWGLWRGGGVNAVVEVGVRMSPRGCIVKAIPP